MEKKRIEFIDLAKGFCILLVVFNHIHETDLMLCSSIFRMPLYFFLSGLFFKTYSGFGEFMLKKTNRLIIPFLFFFCLGATLYFVLWRWTPNLRGGIETDNVYSNIPIWFLLALFEVNIISFLLIKLAHGKTLPCMILFALAGAAGYLIECFNYNIYFFFDTALTSAPFFFAGYIVRQKTNMLQPNKYDKFWLPVTITCFSIVAATYLCYKEKIDLRANIVHYNIFAFYFAALCGIMGILTIAKRIGRLPLISYIGKYSIVLLGVHFLLLTICDIYLTPIIGKHNVLSDTIFFVIIVAASTLTIPAFKKFTPKFIAQEDLIKMPQKKA